MARDINYPEDLPIAKEAKRTIAQRVSELEKELLETRLRVAKLEEDSESHGIRLNRTEEEVGLM